MTKMVTSLTESDAALLEDALTLRPPATLENAANLVRTTRLREVRLDWGAVLGVGNTQPKDEARAFRRYFEESFGVADMEAKSPAWTDADKVDLKLYPNAGPGAWRKAEDKPYFYFLTGRPNPIEVKAGVLLIHDSSKRVYLPLDANGKAIPSAECAFDGNCVWAQYRDFWERIEAVVLVFETKEKAEAGAPQSTFIGSVAAELRSEYAELAAMKEVCDILQGSAEKWGAAAKLDPQFWLQLDSMRESEERYIALGLRRRRVIGLMSQLAVRANAAGLMMPLVETEVTLPDNVTKKKLEPGKVYRAISRTFTWTVTERREHWEWDGDLGKILNRKKLVVDYVPVTRSATGVDYEEVRDEPKPWSDYINRLRAPGANQQDVYLMHLEGDRYVSEEGALLSDILWRCKHDEQARLRTVVALPVFRSSLTGSASQLGYNFFRAPLEPMKPQRLPRIFLRETLSYGIAWRGTEVGQLVGSINLAPGEERTVSVTTSAERQSSTVIAHSLGVETAMAESTDLSTEIEREVRRESSTKGSLSMSASGEFGIDGMNVGGKNDASFSTSVLDFCRDLSRVTTRAARSINRKRTEQYSVTSTMADKSSATSANQLKIANINQGVTANYLLYILNNIYDSAVMVENLQVVVDYGQELLLGSGAYRSQTFPLEGVDKVMEWLRKDDFAIGLSGPQFDRFRGSMVDALAELLMNEYGRVKPKGKSNFIERDSSVNAFDIALDEPLSEDKGKLRLGPAAATLPEKVDRYRTMIKDAWSNGAWIIKDTRRTLSLPSGAMYLDTILGQRPATEPYSEAMRELERQKIAAQIESEHARAYAIRRGWPRAIVQGIVVAGNTVTVTLSAALEGGAWVALYHKSPKHFFEAPANGTMKTVSFNWPQPDIPKEADLMASLSLVNVVSGEVVSAT